MFTIPYEEGWKVIVDGKEIEVEKVLDALIAIKVDSGEHEILLKYTPKGLTLGMTLSISGIILFIIKIIMSKMKKRQMI